MKLINSNLLKVNTIIYLTKDMPDVIIHYVGQISFIDNNVITIDKGDMFLMPKNKELRCFHYTQNFIIDNIDQYTIYQLSYNEYINTHINFMRHDKKYKYEINQNLIYNDNDIYSS